MILQRKFFGLFFAAALVCAALATNAAAQTGTGTGSGQMTGGQMSGGQMTASGDIVAVAMSDSRFTTLVELLKEANLVDTLKGAGPFTVFAPTNDAFAKIPADKLAALKANPEMLKKVLLYHVVPMKVTAAEAKTMMAPTAADVQLSVKKSGNNVMVDKAKVIQADVMASNGVIHAIDMVLMPKTGGKMDKMKTSSMK